MADDALSAGAVARRLGVAVTTLRTWHQRYGLGPSQHVPGHHRRYTPDDLARLETMRRLTAQGVSPGEAARWARRLPEDATRANATAITNSAAAGAPIPYGRAGTAARGLTRAAMRMDPIGMTDAIDRAISAYGVVGAWDTVLRPVLATMGERHLATSGLVEVEHLLSRCVSTALAGAARTHRVRPARLLLACADEEQHSLPLEALAAALAEAGLSCRMLGARVPVAALVDAVARTGPAALVLWSHTPATADPAQLHAVLTAPRRPLLVLAAGPGWRQETLPAGVIRPATIGEAVALAVATHEAVGGDTAADTGSAAGTGGTGSADPRRAGPGERPATGTAGGPRRTDAAR